MFCFQANLVWIYLMIEDCDFLRSAMNNSSDSIETILQKKEIDK